MLCPSDLLYILKCDILASKPFNTIRVYQRDNITLIRSVVNVYRPIAFVSELAKAPHDTGEISVMCVYVPMDTFTNVFHISRFVNVIQYTSRPT